MFEKNKSRILLKLGVINGNLSGELEYALEGKDFHRGTLTGEMLGDIFLGTYLFMSEGTKSSCQVAIRRTATGWVEGFGPVTVVEKDVLFSDLEALDFADGLVYKEVL